MDISVSATVSMLYTGRSAVTYRIIGIWCKSLLLLRSEVVLVYVNKIIAVNTIEINFTRNTTTQYAVHV